MRRFALVALLAFLALSGVIQAQDATVTPTPEEQEPVTLVVWWPAQLVPEGDSEIENLLLNRFLAFEEAEEGTVHIEFRRKAINGPGGIIPTMRSASAVAPGALPDVTLLRREDLITAEAAGLLQRLEGHVSSTILGDLDSALALGQIDNTLYGLPYLLEVKHLVYRPAAVAAADNWSFDAVLERGIPFAFPASRVSGVADMFYLQYLDAGGELSDEGELLLDQSALQTVLAFYEDARNAGLIDDEVFNYTTPMDYRQRFIDGDLNTGVFTSTMYLDMLGEGLNVRSAPIPTQSGDVATVLNGWVWVMITGDTERQRLVERFFTVMMDAAGQEEYARAVNMLPSQLSVLRSWLGEDEQLQRLNNMLVEETLPLAESAGGPLVRAMQTALTAVISGERTAEAATQDVIDQLAPE